MEMSCTLSDGHLSFHTQLEDAETLLINPNPLIWIILLVVVQLNIMYTVSLCEASHSDVTQLYPLTCFLPVSVFRQFCVLWVSRLQRPAVHHGVWETQWGLPALEELGLPLRDSKDPVHQTHQALRRDRSERVPTWTMCLTGSDYEPKSLNISFGSEFLVSFVTTTTTIQMISDIAATSLPKLIFIFLFILILS